MIILKPRSKDQSVIIREAVRVIRRGGVVAFPTETTYGLGCDPRQPKAVANVYKIKGRQKNKPLLMVASGMDQIKKICSLPQKSLDLARRYWPGPLTLVLPVKKSARLAAPVAPRNEAAVRWPRSPFVRALAAAHGFPIVATSANLSGQPDARSGRAAVNAFRNRRAQPYMVIDFGALPRRKPSTVARISEDGRVTLLRQGGVRLPRFQ